MASILRKSIALLKAPGNSLGFQARQRAPRPQTAVVLGNEPKTTLFDWLQGKSKAQAWRREAELRERYDLRALHARSSVLHYAENLALLDRLEALLAGIALPTAALRAVDVGSGVFQYATGLQRALSRAGAIGARPTGPRAVELLGVEVDGHGVYRDGHTRAQHACAHAALAGQGVHYAVADFVGMRLPAHDVATLLFPFLNRYALLQWGLPLGMFQPRRLLRRVTESVRPGGHVLVVNQTGTEWSRLQSLLQAEPLRLLRTLPFATELVPYGERTQERVGSLWQRLP